MEVCANSTIIVCKDTMVESIYINMSLAQDTSQEVHGSIICKKTTVEIIYINKSLAQDTSSKGRWLYYLRTELWPLTILEFITLINTIIN